MNFEHVTFDLPHGTFHALQGGDPNGQPTLVLHGFPDHPPTAKPFLAEFGRRGRHVVAPWLRGYAPFPTAGPFDMAALAGDVLALIDRWSPGRAVELIGHDWGGAITYDVCVTAPERIERAVTLAFPHPLTFLSQPRLAQLRRSWYMGLFQLPGSGWIVSARDLALIDHLWRQWSPSLSLNPALQAELHEHLRASMPAPLKYYRGLLRPGMLGAMRRLSQPIVAADRTFPVEFRVMGPDLAQLHAISEQALGIMRGVPDVRQANRDWGNRGPVLHFIPDQDRLNLIGLSPAEVSQPSVLPTCPSIKSRSS